MKVKNGLTLVEMMCVVGILALLFAILLPAVQSAREASRRTTCQNNLRQIMLASMTYHDRTQEFPLGVWPLWYVWGEIDPNGPASYYTPTYRPPRDRVIPSLFYCSSDGLDSDELGYRPISYFLSSGVRGDGFMRITPLRRSHILDGDSNTISYSEKLIPLEGMQGSDPRRNLLRFPDWSVRWQSIDEFLQAVASVKNTKEFIVDHLGFRGHSIRATIEFNHVGPPNEWNLFGPGYNTNPPSSNHTGGVNGVFADGHVSFLPNSIDLVVWRAIGTIAGHEHETLPE